MITATQLRAARALLGFDQNELASRSGLSAPTIQRMEASDGVIRGNVDSLVKLVAAFEDAGLVFLDEHVASANGGRGVRLKAVVQALTESSSSRLAPDDTSPLRAAKR